MNLMELVLSVRFLMMHSDAAAKSKAGLPEALPLFKSVCWRHFQMLGPFAVLLRWTEIEVLNLKRI